MSQAGAGTLQIPSWSLRVSGYVLMSTELFHSLQLGGQWQRVFSGFRPWSYLQFYLANKKVFQHSTCRHPRLSQTLTPQLMVQIHDWKRVWLNDLLPVGWVTVTLTACAKCEVKYFSGIYGNNSNSGGGCMCRRSAGEGNHTFRESDSLSGILV